MAGHLIFDIKIDFTRKDLWVPDGHKIPSTIESTHAWVVIRESVSVAFTDASLNTLDAFAVDMGNT